MNGYKPPFFYIIFLVPLFAFQNNIAQHYDSGLIAYKNNQYELAIQEFESILEQDWDSPHIYYNLGNAYYRNDNIASAIWAYESCLKLVPTYSDANYNLQLANLKVKDRVDLPEPPIYLKVYLIIKERFSSSMWVNISMFILLLLAISYSLVRMTSLVILNYIFIFFVVLFFSSTFFSLHSIWTNNSVNEGILLNPRVDVRSEPNIFSTRLFEVHEGLKVSVNQVLVDWVKIELLDGKTGWIKNYQIRLIQ